jgi:hypothetical protein
MRPSEISHITALRMLHAHMLGRLGVVDDILDEAAAEHGHTVATMAYDEYRWASDDMDRDNDREAVLRAMVEEVMRRGAPCSR